MPVYISIGKSYGNKGRFSGVLLDLAAARRFCTGEDLVVLTIHR